MRATTRRAGAVTPFDGQLRWRRLRPAPALFAALVAVSLAGAADQQPPKVAVLELRAAVGGGPSDLGVAAARLVSAAIEQTGKYNVIDTAMVEAALAEQELKPPFGVGHLQLLADVLGADLIVHGSIRSLSLDTEARAASAVLSLELVDGTSGALKSRTEAGGAHTAELGVEADDSALILATLARAAENTVEAVTGVAIGTVPEEAIGARGSLRIGTLAAAMVPEAPGTKVEPRTALPGTDLTALSGSSPQPADAPVAPSPSEPVPQPAPAPGGEEKPPEAAATTPTGPADLGAAFRDRLVIDSEPRITVKILVKTDPKRVLVTLGREEPVAPKMELDVYRVTVSRDGDTTKRRIGRIRIVKVNATDAEARILEGGDLMRTGDYGYYEGP